LFSDQAGKVERRQQLTETDGKTEQPAGGKILVGHPVAAGRCNRGDELVIVGGFPARATLTETFPEQPARLVPLPGKDQRGEQGLAGPAVSEIRR